MYKNLTIFSLEKPIANLDLSRTEFTPCTAQQEVSQGFVPINNELVYLDDNCYLHVALKTETKRVPADVLKSTLEKRISTLGFKPPKEELEILKSNVKFELLAKAFPTSKVTQAYITPEIIVVNTASLKHAEELISRLRVALGGLIATPYAIQDVELKMTDLVATGDTLPEDLVICDSALLSGLDSSVKYKHHDLSCSEIKSHIAEGLVVSELGLMHDNVKFTLTETSQFKGLKFDYESGGLRDDCLILADVVDKLLAVTA